MRGALFWGGVSGFLAVALGAFGAHGLRDRVAESAMAWWQTGAHYHLVHSVALVALAFGTGGASARLFRAACWLWGVGILLFSGSLYAMALTDVRVLGAVTPFGGLCLLAGWALLAAHALRLPREERP